MVSAKQIKIIRTSTVAISLNFLLKGQLSFLNKEFEVIAVSGEDEHLRNVVQREDVRSVSIPMRRRISPFHDFISLWQLFWLLKKEKPTIVHSITPKAGLLTMLASKLAGVPIRIHTFTGLIFPSHTGFMQKLLVKMDQLLCWAATNVYPEGNGVKNDLIQFNITSKPLKVLANGNVNGIDLEHFSQETVSPEDKKSLKETLGIRATDFVFIFVGRLVGDKGINELIEAFSQIEQYNVRLLLVGSLEEELDPLLPKTTSEIDRDNRIISVGFQKDVRSFLAISNVFIFPSYREGFPNVVLQAGAMGLPSIVTNINGSNEIIIEKVNGYIIPPKDVAILFETMNLFINNNADYANLCSNSRKLIAERYEQSVVWNALLEEYKILLKKKEDDL